ncbi:unnamed protein product [Fusarium graminearum]|uniref:Chromosome 1, complete genome n=1 Tax=Gibberella zeae (strain ATCC MYA-4620 / CBS 123657 / FGSC 9075 / NRRL 31084 / PH-1) TaxID=229533 RepID=A0A098D2A5_GIBZE|nr:unnamed protein product [Fusarium graminearum]CZS76350.1 unnamed protein product [Fusarium graminearum]
MYFMKGFRGKPYPVYSLVILSHTNHYYPNDVAHMGSLRRSAIFHMRDDMN